MIRSISLMVLSLSFCTTVAAATKIENLDSIIAACASLDQDGGLKSRMKLAVDKDNKSLLRTFDLASDAFVSSLKVNCKDVEKIGAKELRKRSVDICNSKCLTLQNSDETSSGINEITVQCPKTCTGLAQFFEGYVAGIKKGAKDCEGSAPVKPTEGGGAGFR